ncbi:rubredoxin-like domain-containing protein [Clostridium estertheticum]|nr:hypothetical protein [Clostridium estertheticum]
MVCNKCSYIYEGTDAPKICPGCKHPIGYFQLLVEGL